MNDAALTAKGGSSPLARGTSSVISSSPSFPRLIPARAGNMRAPQPPEPATAAHPRSRGEHSCRVRMAKALFGSSPLARGTWLLIWRFIIARRLIPARAGNIDTATPTIVEAAAHPRSRGEHSPQISTFFMPGGSSPLARGTLARYGNILLVTRLIPARAGNI